MPLLSTDIYDMHQVSLDLLKQFMPDESDRTRAIGINGYFADANSLHLQNAVIVASETANEMWPSKAKFEKNVIAHAIIQNITDINAVPSTMRVFIGIPEKTINSILVDGRIILDKETPFFIGNMEFHLQYDLWIIQNIIENNEIVYSARYDISRNNPLSEITNPYISPPFIQIHNTERYLLIEAVLMQVEHSTISRKLLTSNPIENKTFEFEFTNQLANFEVRITEKGKTVYLTPVFDGSAIDQTLEDYCFYSYIEANRIRVRFDSSSYMPEMNAQIDVLIKTTQGKAGEFEYNQNLYMAIDSENYGYRNMAIYMIISTNSTGGRDRKSVDELRRILPKEALSRGSITNMQDLLNYFNIFGSDLVRMQVQKKVDNQFERTYYSYIVLKDSYDNVVPTNTIDIRVSKSDGFDTVENRKRALKPGCMIGFDGKEGFIIKNDEELSAYIGDNDPNKFVYTVPFTTVVTDDPLYVSYYKTIMRYAGLLEFSYINANAPVQFISTGITWRRGYQTDPDTYKLNISFTQNILVNKNIVRVDEAGKIVDNTLKVIAVFYNKGLYDDRSVPYRYFVGDIVDYDIESVFSYDYEFLLKTTDQLNDDAKIKITNTLVPGNGQEDYGYFSGDVDVKLYVLAKFADGEYGRHDLDNIVPNLEGYTVTNMYTVNNGLQFFENFSDIVSSVVKHEDVVLDYDTAETFYIKSVPVIKLAYGDNEENIQSFITQLVDTKAINPINPKYNQ